MPWGLDQKTIDELNEKRAGAHMTSPLFDPRYAAGPTADSTHEEIVPNAQRRKPSFIERAIIWPIVTTARILAILITLTIWLVVIGPVWFAILLRTITAFALATVVALFTVSPPPDGSKLDAAAEFWIRGFGDIIAYILKPNAPSTRYVPLQPMQALRETLLAILLYSGLFASYWTTARLLPALLEYFGWR